MQKSLFSKDVDMKGESCHSVTSLCHILHVYGCKSDHFQMKKRFFLLKTINVGTR